MSEADLDRLDGRTGQGLTDPDEPPGPELDLMTIGVPGDADIAVADAQVTVFSALQPDPLVGDGAISLGTCQRLTQGRRRGEHEVEQVCLAQLECLGEM